MKRVFIIGAANFPRGSAGANYDQYVALSLLEEGWQVIVLGKGRNHPMTFTGDHYEYKGIIYENEPHSTKVKYGLRLKFYKECYKKYNMTAEDRFIVRDLGWLPQWWLAKKCGAQNMCYVHFEDLQPEQFRQPFYLNPQYWSFRLKQGFKLKRMKKALPISETLEKIEQGYGCKTLRLPIMADPDEFGETVKTGKPEVLNFIYPGAKMNGCEDDIKMMLQVFGALTSEEKAAVRLHITGTTEEKLREKLGEDAALIDSLGDTLIIHDWLTYVDLVDLYRKMDFLVLVRFKNPITIANFPSKVPETLSFGIIPVCTRVGDYTKHYLIDNENSIIFGPDSYDECLAAVKRAVHISEEDYLRLRKGARKTAVEKFGYKNWSKRLSEFLLGENE